MKGKMSLIYAAIAWFIADSFLYHFAGAGVPNCVKTGLTLGGLALIIFLMFKKE